MLITIVNVIVLTLTFLYMFCKARLSSTRRVACVPLLAAVMEVLSAGLLSLSLHPVLSAVRLSMLALILISSFAAMRRDTILYRRRQRRIAARRAVQPRAVAIPASSVADPICCA